VLGACTVLFCIGTPKRISFENYRKPRAQEAIDPTFSKELFKFNVPGSTFQLVFEPLNLEL
jgi:hypothetical protein